MARKKKVKQYSMRVGNEELLKQIDKKCEELEELWSKVNENDLLDISLGHRYYSYFCINDNDEYVVRGGRFMPGYVFKDSGRVLEEKEDL